MANDEEWQREQDERRAAADVDKDFQPIKFAAAAGDQEAARIMWKVKLKDVHIDVKPSLVRYVRVTQGPKSKTPSTALINLLFSPKKAKDIKANMIEVYTDIWVPENGLVWATIHWYTHTLAYFFGGLITSPLIAALERVKKFYAG